ncbi:SOS response-associated peptidase [Siminovitchia acidinfaciens]|uniref:Abasic site processing protein n=1 Tax=Siminovitchia acidinfaciens TaxID=2321395 RepID=A0A429Y7R9_9BACI|nr:SOS response-associated peptidase [Siminovitchia acidinfaciens]RST77465.1 SOS response-associated peptidase [Siminovitchia acidinfaciens]
MCGRYSLFANRNELVDRFQIINGEDLEWIERFNIAPSQNVLAIVKDEHGNRAGFLKWGLVPSWANDPKIGFKMINARAETADQKPSFKRLLKRRRCLIAADGFYEWIKQKDNVRKPYRFELKTQEPFAFAGLWDRWESEDEVIHSCTIITTEANDLVKEVHDRMPVILTKDAEEIWLDRSVEDTERLKGILLPYDMEKMAAYPVSTLVNSPKNDTREILNSK